MPGTISATVTAKTGPAQQVTAGVFTNVKAFTVDLNENVLTLFYSNPASYPSRDFDLTGVTTFTVSISSGNYTVTVS